MLVRLFTKYNYTLSLWNPRVPVLHHSASRILPNQTHKSVETVMHATLQWGSSSVRYRNWSCQTCLEHCKNVLKLLSFKMLMGLYNNLYCTRRALTFFISFVHRLHVLTVCQNAKGYNDLHHNITCNSEHITSMWSTELIRWQRSGTRLFSSLALTFHCLDYYNLKDTEKLF